MHYSVKLDVKNAINSLKRETMLKNVFQIVKNSTNSLIARPVNLDTFFTETLLKCKEM